jgi:hypothetical protein
MPVYIVVDKNKDIKAAFLLKADADLYIEGTPGGLDIVVCPLDWGVVPRSVDNPNPEYYYVDRVVTPDSFGRQPKYMFESDVLPPPTPTTPWRTLPYTEVHLEYN